MAYELVETVTLSSNATSIDITGIPQDAVDLLIVGSVRSDDVNGNFRFNNTGDFNILDFQVSGNTRTSTSQTAQSSYGRLFVPSTSFSSGVFGNFRIYVAGYTSNTNKAFGIDTVLTDTVFAPQKIAMQAGLWTQTAAITEFNLIFDTYQTGSTISIYKIY